MKHTRPLTDYKKSKLIETYIEEYQKLNNELLELMHELREYNLTTDDSKRINSRIEELVTRLNEVVFNMENIKY